MKQSKPTQATTRPAVIFQPALLDGINLIAETVKPTLGPLPRFVAIEANMRDRPPELLDDAGTIARRIVQVADPAADAGAMMLRHALWRMHEQCGDGSATMAVIAQALMQQAAKAVAAGAHPALLRRGIDQGIERAVQSLHAQAIRLPGGRQGRELLASLAKSLCHDDELRDVLVEIVDIAGADGAIQVVNNDGRRVDREYVEGAMWESPWLTGGFATDAAQKIGRIEDASVVLLDGKLDTAANALTGLKRLHDLGVSSIVVIAGDIADEAKAVFIQAKLSGMFKILPIKAPGFDAKRAVALQDIAALTGARVLFEDGAGFARLSQEDLGEVRRAWATAKQFGLIGGRRDPAALRASVASVRAKIEDTTDLSEINDLRQRLGRLCGGLAIVRVGAATSKMQDARKDEAIRLARAMQMAARRGMIAGGGAALFRAGKDVRAHVQADEHADADMVWGMRCVARALEAPLAVIAANAGFDSPDIVGQVRVAQRNGAGDGHGFDARRGEVTDMRAAGILDSAETVERALRIAGSLAGMAITTDAVVLHRKPQMSTNP
jgi:chaperonin GroEL